MADVEETSGKKIYRKQIALFAKITWKRTVEREYQRMNGRNSLAGGLYATMVVLKRENTSEITYFIEYHAPPRRKKTDDDKKVCPERWTFKKKNRIICHLRRNFFL